MCIETIIVDGDRQAAKRLEKKCGQMVELHLAGNFEDPKEALDYALASLAIEVAVTRHAGHLEQYYSPMGISYMQMGKDLTAVKTVIVTGGALIHTKRTAQIASHALFNPLDAFSLKPKEAQVLVDRKYILAAMGILSTEYPQTALRIMKMELVKDGNH